jgi:hypothetical protein
MVAFLVCCTGPTQTAGPSTEEGNPAVMTGVVLDSSGAPVSGARIIVYSSMDAPGVPESEAPPSIPVAGTVSAGDGTFSFAELYEGIYILESYNEDGTAYAMKKHVVVTGDSTPRGDVDTLVLGAPGTIRGVVSRGGVRGIYSNVLLDNAFIQVRTKEIDRGYVTATDGAYELSGVPAGVYTLLFYASDGFFTAVRESVEVECNVVTEVDTVVLQRIPWASPPKPEGLSALYDTAAATVALTWEPVVVADLRGYEIERIDSLWQTDTLVTTTDTTYVDDISAIPSGARIYYVVRSVNAAFMRSANEGPVEIEVRHAQ